VKIKIREKISKTQWKQREERRRWNLEKFKEEGCLREYKEETTNQITQYQASQEGKPTTEEGWGKIEQSVKQAANKVIGKETKKKHNEWYDDECTAITEEQNEAIQRNTRSKWEKYRQLRRTANNICKAKKRNNE
jgi:hypothetical protein